MGKAKKGKGVGGNGEIEYKQMTVEILFTDGEMTTANFYTTNECFEYVERSVRERWADSVRVELF